MRVYRIILVTVLMGWGLLALGADVKPVTNAQLLKEINELKQMVAELQKKAEVLEQRLAQEADKNKGKLAADDELDDFGFPGMGDWQRRGPNMKLLRKAKLPENPTKDQVRAYVRKIANATKGQNTFGSTDPQVRMLMKVGGEHLDVLIDALDRDLRYYAIEAVPRLAEEGHKKLILQKLAQKPNLVKVVVSRGWEQDAKEILTRKLDEWPDSLPREWIEAVAAFEDPKTYDGLIDYLVFGSNKSHT